MIANNNHIDKPKVVFHSLFVNIDKVSKLIHNKSNIQDKKQKLFSKNKKVTTQNKPSSQISNTKFQDIKKKTKLVLNKVDMFKNVKKQSEIFTNQLQINNQSSNLSIKSGKTEKTSISRSNSISNFDPSTDSTTTSKRMIKDIHSNLTTKTKNSHCSYLNTEFSDVKKKAKLKQNYVIPNQNNKLSVELIYNNKKPKKRQKNKSMTLNSNVLNTNTYNKEGNLSILSEDSIFNFSKHRSTSNTHNESGSNKINKKHSSKSNSFDKKSKSTSIDLTYSDDEVISNRKKCKQLIIKNFEKHEKIKNKQQLNDKQKDCLDFESFCNELNERLFGNKN